MNFYRDEDFMNDALERDLSMDTIRRCYLSTTNLQELHEETQRVIDQYKMSYDQEQMNFSAANMNQFEPDEFYQKGEQERYFDKYSELTTNFEDEIVPFINSNLDLAQISEKIVNSNKLASNMAKRDQWKTAKVLQAAGRCRRRRSADLIALSMQNLFDDPILVDELRLNSGRLNGYLAWEKRWEMEKRLNYGISKLQVARKLIKDKNGRLHRNLIQARFNRGKVSDSAYETNNFGTNAQKIFLGGLPYWIVESSLCQKLSEHGYIVINKPRVLRGFCPEVCLKTVEQAQSLIRKGKIMIDGCQVDVRQYQTLDHLKNKFSDDIKRSVFLGGLRTGTTGQIIKNDLKKLGVSVVNNPIIKAGFTPQVMLLDREQAKKLVRLEKVRIYGELVDVRPYVVTRERLMYSTRNESVANLYQ